MRQQTHLNESARVVVLGLDGMVPNTVERFMAEGLLPNIKRLTERGCFSRMLPVIPAQTPTNWNTLATGATPGGHGVVQWGSHIPGEEVWEYHRAEAFNEGLCRAEYIWETAARHGKRSVLFNYAGYPSTTDNAVTIDWLFQPARSYFDTAGATVYHNCPDLDTRDPIVLRKASGWRGGPESSRPLLEADIPVIPSESGTGPTYHLLLSGGPQAYDSAMICEQKDPDTACARLSVGDWSPWITGSFGDSEATFRFKLVELSADARRIRLYRTDAFPADGRMCSNHELGEELLETCGPYVHAASSFHLQSIETIDWQTMAEIFDMERTWWSSAAKIAMERQKASLLYLHWHILDSVGHAFVQYIDPEGSSYDEKQAPRYWDLLRKYYTAADSFVGAFLSALDDRQTTFFVLSDHGMPANKKAVSLINRFRDEGWVEVSADGRSVLWEKSKLFFSQNHLWINLEGRDNGGIVPASQYAELRRKVLATMRDIKDPETGDHVFSFVLTREEAPIVGLWGDYIGDIAYCYAGGYRWSGPEVLAMAESRVVFPCAGGNHGPMIPTYETEATSVMATLIACGPGIRADGRSLPRSSQPKIWTKDVAPTVAHLLGISFPAQNEGRVIAEFLADVATEMPTRTLQPTARAIVARKQVRPSGPVLQGDVTDEAG